METRKFTVEQIQSFSSYGTICDEEGNELYTTELFEQHSYDQEKSSITNQVVVHEIKTDKYFRAYLYEGPWYRGDEYNAEQIWKEVKPYTKTVTYYK